MPGRTFDGYFGHIDLRAGGVAVLNWEADEAILAALSDVAAEACVPKLTHNCRNCGAPPEPVCSYCGTVLASSG
jgi:hypothetical protein